MTGRTPGSRLTARFVATVTKPGRYGDGGGLYLQVGPTGGKAWVVRYMRDGRARMMGLGPADLVSLAAAREKARDVRRLLLDGLDPLEVRRAQGRAARAQVVKTVTFRECAARYVAAHEASWRNEKHRRQWRSTLDNYADPVLGELSVADVDTGLVMQVLEPMWNDKPETASRLRGRIEAILDWAKVRGHRGGENPARWRGHLDKIVPARTKLQRVRHHAALNWTELPAFMRALRARGGTAARALEFLILTAARTGEILGAHWSEIDMERKVWAVPAHRMKAGRPHRVPLSDGALAVLEGLPRDAGDLVFIGGRASKPLSQMALAMLLRRMRKDITVHGFRSTFRDWAGEATSHPGDVIEAALAHMLKNKVEAAYARGDLFEKRRRLMMDWDNFSSAAPQEGRDVVPLRKRRA